MKKILLSVLFLVAFSFAASAITPAIPVIYGNGPEFVKLKTLPDSVTLDDKHVNFGVAFEEFHIFWIPVWTYGDVEYVAIEDNGKSAYRLDEEDLAHLSEAYGIDTEKKPSVPFWHKIGGKLIWASVIVLAVWGFGGKKNDDEDEQQAVTEEPSQPAEE
ncbi:MAG: hypothetical protein LBU95_00995 [Rikenellaceae bacterium]|jgi:hypothetical protein|nr:hypothetical protein [Rikenellaceae bacterium]